MRSHDAVRAVRDLVIAFLLGVVAGLLGASAAPPPREPAFQLYLEPIPDWPPAPVAEGEKSS